MKRVFLIALILLVIYCGFLLSEVSYLVVRFEEPMKPQQFMDYLAEHSIEPSKHSVNIGGVQIGQPEGLIVEEFIMREWDIKEVAFSPALQSLKTVFDSGVGEWEFEGPRHPYD